MTYPVFCFYCTSLIREFNRLKPGCCVGADPRGGGVRRLHAALSVGATVPRGLDLHMCILWKDFTDFEEQEIHLKCIYSSQKSLSHTSRGIYLYERMFCTPNIMHFKSQLQWDDNSKTDINILSLIHLTSTASSASSAVFIYFSFHLKELFGVLQINMVTFFWRWIWKL